MFGGTQSNDWNDVLIDDRQRIWLAGYGEGRIGEQNIEPSGDSHAVVQLLSPDGRVLWSSDRRLDTSGTDVADALALTPQGRVVVAGRTTGSMTGAPNAGQFDTFVAWADQPESGGDWRIFQTGSRAPQHPQRVAVGSDGQWHVAGYDDDHVPTNYVEAWTDPFAMRLAPAATGNTLDLRWHRQFATPEPDLVEGLAVAPDSRSSFVSGQATGVSRGAFIRKYDADGQALWTARYTSNALDSIRTMHAMSDGTIWIAGDVFGSFQGRMPIGQQDVFVARIAADSGRVLMGWQFGSSAPDALADLNVDRDGNVYLLGETQGAMHPGTANAGASDLFILKVSPDGQVLASRQWGTANDERARRLAVDRCGRVLAVGSTTQQGRRNGVLWYWKP